MKLKYTFEIVDLGNETVAVAVGKDAEKLHGVLKINKSGAEILDLLSNETTETSIIETLHSKYNYNEQEEIIKYVHHFLENLRKQDLIQE